MNMGRNFLSSLGIVSPAADPSTSVRGNRVNGPPQAIEYVIRRAGTQIGVPPYSWGGGSLTGPTRGVDQGADTVGFDCSALRGSPSPASECCCRDGPATSTTPAERFLPLRLNAATCCSGGPAEVNTKRSTWAEDR